MALAGQAGRGPAQRCQQPVHKAMGTHHVTPPANHSPRNVSRLGVSGEDQDPAQHDRPKIWTLNAGSICLALRTATCNRSARAVVHFPPSSPARRPIRPFGLARRRLGTASVVAAASVAAATGWRAPLPALPPSTRQPGAGLAVVTSRGSGAREWDAVVVSDVAGVPRRLFGSLGSALISRATACMDALVPPPYSDWATATCQRGRPAGVPSDSISIAVAVFSLCWISICAAQCPHTPTLPLMQHSTALLFHARIPTESSRPATNLVLALRHQAYPEHATTTTAADEPKACH